MPQREAGAGRLQEPRGTWVNSDPRPREIASLTLRAAPRATIARVLGPAAGGRVDWGEAVVGPLFTDAPGSTTAAGFLLDYELGPARAHLQVQLKLGVAVVGTFVRLDEPSGERLGFVREFLGRLPAGARPLPPVAGGSLPERPATPADLSAGLTGATTGVRGLLAGSWLATAASPRTISSLEIADRGASGLGLEIRGADGAAWGHQLAEPFPCVEEDGVPSLCLLADYSLPSARIELQIRQNKGILAVTTFTRHPRNDAAPGRVERELFYRAAGGARRPST